MKTYRNPVVILVVAAGLLAAASAASATAAKRTCVAPSGSQVTRADDRVILYRKTLGDDPLNKRLAYWACLRTTGKRTRLTDGTTGSAETPTLNSSFRFSRRYVAYVQTSKTRGTSLYYLFAYDLRRGRRLQGVGASGLPVGGAVFAPDGRPSSRIVSLRVSDRGGLAWRTHGPQFPATQPNVDSISVFDRTGKQTLDSAPPGTLSGPTLNGEVVQWRAGTSQNTYRLQTGT